MNNEDKRKIKVGIAISTFAILFYLMVQNIGKIKAFIGFFTGLFTAFIIGLCFAFVLNIIMRTFESKVMARLNEKKHKKLLRFKRPISILVTLILFFSIVTTLIAFIIPQLGKSVSVLVENVPDHLNSLQDFANKTLQSMGISAEVNETITKFITDLSNSVVKLLSNAVPHILDVTKSITSGIINTLLGFVIGVYMLASKEKLLRNTKKVLYAFVPKKAADYTTHVYRLTKDRFSGFVTGQLTEAFILGALCFIGMTILNMKYALLISVIIGLTNMVPVIGPIIGSIPGVLIMLMADPKKAIWFIVFIIILQQLESNLIYPKVVGDSLGLPGIWVIFAISVGGSLFGLVGVLLGVPTFAVIYSLISETTDKNLKKKGLQIT